jgi:hypothetical protein
MKRLHCSLSIALLVLTATVVWATPDLEERAASALTVEESRLLLREAGTGSDAEARTVRGIIYHNLFRLGDPSALVRADEELSGLDSPVAAGYLGSVRTLQGGVAVEGGNFLAATRLVMEGFDLIDDAVRRDPDSITLRFLRAENGLSVSEGSPFKRYDVVARDVAYLMDHPALATGEDRAHVLYLSGMVHLAQGGLAAAIDLFSRTHRIAPESAWGREAAVYLWELEE